MPLTRLRTIELKYHTRVKIDDCSYIFEHFTALREVKMHCYEMEMTLDGYPNEEHIHENKLVDEFTRLVPPTCRFIQM